MIYECWHSGFVTRAVVEFCEVPSSSLSFVCSLSTKQCVSYSRANYSATLVFSLHKSKREVALDPSPTGSTVWKTFKAIGTTALPRRLRINFRSVYLLEKNHAHRIYSEELEDRFSGYVTSIYLIYLVQSNHLRCSSASTTLLA